jgi:hypothetical protein
MRSSTLEKLKSKIDMSKVKNKQDFVDEIRDKQREIYGTTCENHKHCLDVSTEEAITKARNHMAEFGNYPLGMTICEIVGLNGGCGPTCLALIQGNCEYEGE